jgi:hypothetical protein
MAGTPNVSKIRPSTGRGPFRASATRPSIAKNAANNPSAKIGRDTALRLVDANCRVVMRTAPTVLGLRSLAIITKWQLGCEHFHILVPFWALPWADWLHAVGGGLVAIDVA